MSISSKVRHVIDHIKDRKDLKKSREMDVSQCTTLCLCYGPYRNLTTLTASILFLHPHCQVLNHGGKRIFDTDEIDFLKDYSLVKENRFLQYAVQISNSFEENQRGGSIVNSHAFKEHEKMREVYGKTEGQLIKNDIHSLFWKESLLSINHMNKYGVDIENLVKKSERLRFLMPVRNPLAACRT